MLIETFEQWNAYAEKLSAEGYKLWQWQYNYNDPEGFNAYWRQT
jgi:hypothetical protein